MTATDARPHRSRWRAVALALCGLVLAGAAGRVAIHDPADLPVSGDQASFVYQAVSIAGGNLSYDAQDQEAWTDLGWEDQPRGLFVQRRSDGWAFAKPLGYSALLAPGLDLVGVRAVSLLGAGLLVAYAATWYFIGRRRWDEVTAAAVATTATVASHAWFFAFPAHADLFVAVLVGVAALGGLRVATRSNDVAPTVASTVWLAAAAGATGLLVTEKLPALVALGPLLALAAWRAPMRARVVAAAVGIGVVAVSIVPYLYYSDGDSWSAYGGDRFYAPSTTPWSGGTDADLVPWRTSESLSPANVVDGVVDPSEDLAGATVTYVAGRHTGVLVFQPLVGALAVAGVVVAVRRRRADSDSDPGSGTAGGGDVVAGERSSAGDRGVDTASAVDGPVLAAALAGIAGYAGLYLLAFTDNYYGGGQSVGNRYFLQISAVVAVAAVAGGVGRTAARWSAGAAAVGAAVLLTPHLLDPSEAFYRLERTSPVQRGLPFDASQDTSWRFSCEPETCVPPPVEPYGEE